MELSGKTAREMFEDLRATMSARYGFGERPMIVNVDLQRAYTAVGAYPTAYENDPRQMEYVNAISRAARGKGFPVVWTYVAYDAFGDDCGVFGTRADDEDALKNIKAGSDRARLDERLEIDPVRDVVLSKKMPSAFFETHIQSLAVFKKIDTVIVTGGSTSGCVRATVVDSLSRGYRTIVPEQCVADLHESPHFANLYDMHKKYADVVDAREVLEYLSGL